MTPAGQARGARARRGLDRRPRLATRARTATPTTCSTGCRRRAARGSRPGVPSCSRRTPTTWSPPARRRASASRRPMTRRGSSTSSSRGWLERAHGATTSGDWRLDVIVPAPYPRPHGAQGRAELEAMRKTLETVQARAGVDLEARKGDPIYARLSPTLAAVQSALDSAVGLAPGHSPRPELQATLAQTLLGGLDRAYQAGQLLAKPELLANRGRRPADHPAGIGRAHALPSRRPGLRPVVPDRPDRAQGEARRRRLGRAARGALAERPGAGEDAGDPGGDRRRARGRLRRLPALRSRRHAEGGQRQASLARSDGSSTRRPAP